MWSNLHSSKLTWHPLYEKHHWAGFNSWRVPNIYFSGWGSKSNRSDSFFNYTVQLRYLQRSNAHTLTPMNIRVQTYLYEYLRKLSRQIFNIDKVTTDALLLMGTSPTTKKHTKKHTLLNPIKNLLLQKSNQVPDLLAVVTTKQPLSRLRGVDLTFF